MILVVNVCENWGIGKADQLLVTIPPDMKRFRALTTGKTLIYGRKTLLTFPGGRVLPKRRNIILSSDPSLVVDGGQVAHNLPELFAMTADTDPADLCVIGGESLYRQLLPYCTTAHVTRTLHSCEADRFFPNLDAMDNWQLLSQGPVEQWEGWRYQFVDYVNLSPLPWPAEPQK